MANHKRGFVQLEEPVTIKQTREKGVILSKGLGEYGYTVKLNSGAILKVARSQFIRIKNLGHNSKLRYMCEYGYTSNEHRKGYCHYLHKGNKTLKEWY